MKETLDALNKYGVTAGMVVAVIWLNSRLDTVEERLYDCWKDQLRQSQPQTEKHFNPPEFRVAILPEPIKPRRNETNRRTKTN